MRTIRQVKVEKIVFVLIGQGTGLQSRIVGVLTALMGLARDADARTTKQPTVLFKE
jgi:hypothetical protein